MVLRYLEINEFSGQDDHKQILVSLIHTDLYKDPTASIRLLVELGHSLIRWAVRENGVSGSMDMRLIRMTELLIESLHPLSLALPA